MNSPTIQRQSILSSIAIVVGFGIGGINMLILFPRLMSNEQFGLTRVVNDFSVIAANFATLGSLPIIGKFFPYYRRYLLPGQRDLVAIAGSMLLAGLLVATILLLTLQPAIIQAFGRNNPIFPAYYWSVIPFTLFYACFLFTEPFSWYAGQSVLANVLKETLFRGLTLISLLLFGFRLISFDVFMGLFSVSFLIPALVLFYINRRKGVMEFTPNISHVTRRLGGKMGRFSAFMFATTLVSITASLCDTLFLAGRNGFALAAVFAIAQYASNLLEVPMRSMTGSAIPVLAEYWRAGNLKGIHSIYKKSSINLLLAGLAIGGVLIINIPNLILFLPANYAIIAMPMLVLILGRWINLAGGLNAQIIQTSKHLTFEFGASLLLSLVAIPLNFFLIKYYSIMGAAVANCIVWTLFNLVRFLFLYRRFGLQPFSLKTIEAFLMAALVMAGIYQLPHLPNLYADTLLRTLLFLPIFATMVLGRSYSQEVNGLWQKWSGKLGWRR